MNAWSDSWDRFLTWWCWRFHLRHWRPIFPGECYTAHCSKCGRFQPCRVG